MVTFLLPGLATPRRWWATAAWCSSVGRLKDWVEAPTKRGQPPEPRFQHSCMFLNSKLLIVGGRGSDVNKPLPTAVYDTETCEWRNLASVNRFRHSNWGMGPLLFAYGGFDHK